MSLNHIELKDILLGELYRNNLLSTERSASAPPATAASPAVPPANPNTASSPAVSSPATNAAKSPAGNAAYRTLGNNKRRITIVVHAPEAAFLPDEQLSFLTKMLEACRMNMADVAIVNHAASPVNIAPLKEQLHPQFLLLFGLQPTDIRLPLDFPTFKIQDYDHVTYLSSPSLGELILPGEQSKLLKSKLWVSLKTLFGI